MQSTNIVFKLLTVSESDCVICVPYSGKVWRIDSFRAYGERKFGELIDQPIGYQL